MTRAPLRRPWWRCQAIHWWRLRMITDGGYRVDVCTRHRWHRGEHIDRTWQTAGDGWMLPFAVIGPSKDRVYR
jgi:hypothetical protein